MGIITISRQIGAGETTIAPEVARRLGWECLDRKLLDRLVAETGISLPYVAHYDERIPGKIEAWRHPGETEKYFQVLRRILQEYAQKGNAVIVGRGGNFFLRDADALHYRLIAPLPFRIQRVMEVRWVNEGPARETIAQSDRDRAEFIQHYFRADWDNPEHYHAVLNTARLGIETVTEWIVEAARRRWGASDETGPGAEGQP